MNMLTAKQKAGEETGVDKRRVDKVKGQFREDDICIRNIINMSKN